MSDAVPDSVIVEIDAAELGGDQGLLIVTADYYRLAPSDAERIVDEVRTAVSAWEAVAAASKLGPDEMETIREAVAAYDAWTALGYLVAGEFG